jgi:hypothetical protein
MSPPSKLHHYDVWLVKHNVLDFARQRFVDCSLDNSGQRQNVWSENRPQLGASIVDGLPSLDEIADIFASKCPSFIYQRAV